MSFSIFMILTTIIMTISLLFAYLIRKPHNLDIKDPDITSIGDKGEKLVQKVLGKSIDGVQQVFNDYKFFSNGKSIQIDHIFINKNGIYVIETKNIHGTIYGNEAQREWTQILAYGNVKNKFYNPIKQNSSHIYGIKKFLPKNIEIISLVVFIDADIENVDSNNVCTLDELDEILNINYETTINPKQIDYIANILRRYQNNNISNKEHIHTIHKMKHDIENNICPRCGAKLVIRNGDYGEFYGCSNYPQCKFKKKS